MQHMRTIHEIAPVADTTYALPELTFIGDAGDVIMGMPGGGFDGAYGMTDQLFEFEADVCD